MKFSPERETYLKYTTHTEYGSVSKYYGNSIETKIKQQTKQKTQPLSHIQLKNSPECIVWHTEAFVSEYLKAGFQGTYLLAQGLSNLIKHNITLYTFL